jgi:hypothetical protein
MRYLNSRNSRNTQVPLDHEHERRFHRALRRGRLNGVVTVSYFNELRREGMNLRLAVIKGSVMRLRPVLSTAGVAALGLIPLLFATGPGSEIQKPVAAVVIGGLISSTFLTLFILPTLYNVFERRSRPIPHPLPNSPLTTELFTT